MASLTPTKLAGLLSLKRYENPSENFFRDIIQEFHKNMEKAAPKRKGAEVMKKTALAGDGQ